MKLACSSGAFDRMLRSGDLTQLEWIDVCAHELAADGIVLDVRHFPRTDTDYLAQLKKMAADQGLTVVALYDPAFLGAQARDQSERSLEYALRLGAPLIAAPLPAETELSRAQLQARLADAAAHAKRVNVTIAVRNGPQTFAASTHDMKRVLKETDSAWLRYGPQFERFDASDSPEELTAKTVLAWHDAESTQGGVVATARLLLDYHGFVTIDAASGDARPNDIKNALRMWREASHELIIDRT